MNNIQFFHKRLYKNIQKLGGMSKQLDARGGVTFALDVLPLSQNLAELRSGESVMLSAGIALCSKKDNYNKKIGRNIAKGKLQSKSFQVVDINDKYISLELGGLVFTVLIFGQKLHFVSVE